MRTTIFQRGESIPCWAEVKDHAGTYIDPSQGVFITISEPDGTLAKDGVDDIDDTAMSKSDTGKYVYYYDSASDDPVKHWNFFCKAIDGEGDDARTTITHGGFKLT